MRMLDPDLELVVCGSSNHTMDSFGKWEETVLEHTSTRWIRFSTCLLFPAADGERLARHGVVPRSGVDMDGFIKDVAPAIDATKARLKSDHNVYISFDEWNVWYYEEEPSKNPEGIGNWPVAPRLLEDVYTVPMRGGG